MNNITHWAIGGLVVFVLVITIELTVTAKTPNPHLAVIPATIKIPNPSSGVDASSSAPASLAASSTQHYANQFIAFDFPAQWTVISVDSGNKQSDYPSTFPYHDGGSVSLSHPCAQPGNVNRYMGDIQLLNFTSRAELDNHIIDLLAMTSPSGEPFSKMLVGERTAYRQYHARGNKPNLYKSIMIVFPMENADNTLAEISVLWLPLSEDSAIVADDFVTTVVASLRE